MTLVFNCLFAWKMLGEKLVLLKIVGMILISVGAACIMIFASYESNIYTIDVRIISSLGI